MPKAVCESCGAVFYGWAFCNQNIELALVATG